MEKTIKATNITELNNIRAEVVAEMKTSPKILTVWQAKYWRFYNENRDLH